MFFRDAAQQIREAAEATEVYRLHYRRERSGQTATVLNYRWESDRVVGVALQRDERSRFLVIADDQDRRLARSMRDLEVSNWHPTCRFPPHPSVGQRFITSAGGDTIDFLWTRRNLYLLSHLFKQIRSVANPDIRLQLLSAFVQTLHLCTKMVIPRHEEAERDFSGSWGRPDYMIRRRQMEQNPVDVFWRSCTGRQGILSMMRDAAETFPNGIDIHDARAAGRIRNRPTLITARSTSQTFTTT